MNLTLTKDNRLVDTSEDNGSGSDSYVLEEIIYDTITDINEASLDILGYKLCSYVERCTFSIKEVTELIASGKLIVKGLEVVQSSWFSIIVVILYKRWCLNIISFLLTKD